MIPAGMMDERVSPRWRTIARKRCYGGDPEFCAAVLAVIAEIKAPAPT